VDDPRSKTADFLTKADETVEKPWRNGAPRKYEILIPQVFDGHSALAG
jgi:hypothetical protein